MWVREPGRVTDRLDFLGTHENCLYLLRGKEAMIIGGGMSWTAPSLEKQFSVMDFEPDKLRYLVIAHSHFDHCGAVPYLKRKFPHMQILAAAYSKEVFSKEKAVSFIAATNKQMIDRLELQGEYERLNLAFDGVHVDRVVAEGDIIELGDNIEAHFMEVPGHTRCCIAVYVPELRALFPSDAAPPPTEDASEFFFPGAQYDFSMYKESLERLANYEVEICAFEHRGVVTGDQAMHVLRDGLRRTEEFKNRVVELYRQTGDIDKTAQGIAADTSASSQFEFMDLELQTTVLKTVIHKVLIYAGLIGSAPAP